MVDANWIINQGSWPMHLPSSTHQTLRPGSWTIGDLAASPTLLPSIAIGRDHVDVITVRLLDRDMKGTQCLPLLTSAEIIKANGYRRKVDAITFAYSRALLRLVVARAINERDPLAVQLTTCCPSCGGPHGQTRLADPNRHISVSRSGTWIAVATGLEPVGIDVETGQIRSDEIALARLVDDGATTNLTCRWAVKEALLKATGDGLVEDPRAIKLNLNDERVLIQTLPSSFGDPSVWQATLYQCGSSVLAVASQKMRPIRLWGGRTILDHGLCRR